MSKEGVFCVTPNGVITDWGDVAEDRLGYSAEEAIGSYCFDLLGSKGESFGKPCYSKCTILNNARQNRSSNDFSAAWKRKNGEWLLVEVSTINLDFEETGKKILHVFKENATPRAISEAAAKALSMDGQSVEGFKLTPRERQTLRLVAAGLSTPEIAAQLGIARTTARNHIILAINKLCATNRTHAVVKAIAGSIL
jgi:PAS domain S-box-containing protein